MLRKGLPWFPSSAVIANIGANMSIGATIMHVLLWYGRDIIQVIRKYRVSNSVSFFLSLSKKNLSETFRPVKIMILI